ncbi:MAG: dihydrodipicolinate synthase family protein, partial [Pseudomonadota bacterium]
LGASFPDNQSRSLRQVVDAFNAGSLEHARDLFDAYMPMVRYEAQPGLGLAIRKHSLARQGIIKYPTLRKPGASLSAQTINEVNAIADRQKQRLIELGM